jgi:glutathione synthase/RimK-type ligase-like ATP-grasp enzyme
MKRSRIGFATSERWANLTTDDRLAVQALEARDAQVIPVVWDRAGVPDVDVLVIRSIWDYHQRPRELLDWLATLVQAGLPVWNPTPVLCWNLNKRYLRQLERAGISVVETAWIETDPPSLAQLLEQHRWDDVVVKPAVSASAWRTFRSHRGRAVQDEPAYREALEGGLVMVQPFAPQIVDEGEWSLVYLGGRFSHALLKRPRPGGFLVQAENGGTAEPATPTAGMRRDAERALGAAPGPVLYARVDGIRDGDRLVLMELELLEPALFFELGPDSAPRFANALLGL